MIKTIIISLVTCVTLIASILFFPKIKLFKRYINTYWVISLIGALLIICFNCVSVKSIFSTLLSSSPLNPLKILVLFFSMTFLSVFLDEVGFFRYVASVLINKMKSNQTKLFVSIYFIVALLTIFTSNDIVILTFTPFICYFSKNAKINPIPYLVAEFAAANTWSMMLVIGNPTNIYLATYANIGFIDYLKVMFLPTISAGLVQLLIMLIVFKKSLSKEIEISNIKTRINGRLDLVFGLAHLLICLLFLVASSYLKISMWLICVICALSLMGCISTIHIIRKQKIKVIFSTLKRLPYELIVFVVSMFVIVLSLNNQGVTDKLSVLIGENNVIIKYGFISFVSANLINNIPMSVLFSTIPNMSDSTQYINSIYSIIIGSNIGAFLTPIGALAGIMFTDLISRQNIKFSFISFVKYGCLISIPTLLISLLTLGLKIFI